MKIKLLSGIVSLALMSCGFNNSSKNTTSTEDTQEEKIAEPEFQNEGHELIYAVAQKVGNKDSLWAKKDVIYTYTYKTPDGKADISTEKYLFDGELSYGSYSKHERTLPQLEGVIEQGFDGEEYWLRHNETYLSDEEMMKQVAFNRPTNFYWFTMMQKLLDDGINYEYLNKKTIDSTTYDVVKITFDLNEDKPTDIYQVYINEETNLIDRFLFTVADFNVIETPYLMVLEYEEIDNMLIPTSRKYKKSSWDGELTDEPWIYVNWTNIKFDNGLNRELFTK